MKVHECPKAIICGYCPFSYDFESIIKHLFQPQPTLPLKYKECGEFNGQEGLMSLNT